METILIKPLDKLEVGSKVKLTRYGIFPGWTFDWAEKLGADPEKVYTVILITERDQNNLTGNPFAVVLKEFPNFYLPVQHFELIGE